MAIHKYYSFSNERELEFLLRQIDLIEANLNNETEQACWGGVYGQ